MPEENLGHSFFNFDLDACLVKGVAEYENGLADKDDDSKDNESDLGGDIGSCLTSPRKFSSMSQASSLSFCISSLLAVSLSVNVSSPLLLDIRLLLGRG